MLHKGQGACLFFSLTYSYYLELCLVLNDYVSDLFSLLYKWENCELLK